MSLINTWIIIKIGLSILIPVLTGFFLTGALLQSTPLRRNFGLALALGAALGWGLHALLYFGWRVTGLASGWVFLFDSVLLVASGLLFLRQRPYFRSLQQPDLPRRWRVFLGIVLVLALVLAGLPMLVGYAWYPHGTWDAWSIWSLAARYFYLGGADWTQLFHLNNFHPDYPVLVGASLARLWTYLATHHPLAGGLNAAFVSLTTVVLAGSSLAMVRGRWISILGVLLLLGSSSFMAITVAQIADIPLGLFILAIVVCSYLASELPGPQPVLWGLSGAFAGLAAWTKNEGLLVVVCFLAVQVGLHLAQRDWRRAIRPMLSQQVWIGCGLLPLLLALAAFKITYAPPNDLVAAQGGETLAGLMDGGRIRLILMSFLKESYTFRPKISVPMVALPLFLALAGVRRDSFRSRSFWQAAIFLVLLLAGYFFVYLVSPYDAAWHLETSIHRLFLHLWPSAVFLTMLLVRLPEFSFNSQTASQPSASHTPTTGPAPGA